MLFGLEIIELVMAVTIAVLLLVILVVVSSNRNRSGLPFKQDKDMERLAYLNALFERVDNLEKLIKILRSSISEYSDTGTGDVSDSQVKDFRDVFFEVNFVQLNDISNLAYWIAQDLRVNADVFKIIRESSPEWDAYNFADKLIEAYSELSESVSKEMALPTAPERPPVQYVENVQVAAMGLEMVSIQIKTAMLKYLRSNRRFMAILKETMYPTRKR